jgi:hypothetical protein
MARTMGFSSNSSKFIVLLTDEGHYDNNRYNVKDMNEEINLLKKDGITVYVITTEQLSKGNDPQGGYDEGYEDLYTKTGGEYANIYQDFSTVLGNISKKISNIVNDGSWILLSDLSLVKLDKDPNLRDSEIDTDKDGIIDIKELTNKINILISPDKYIEAWSFNSNPVKIDTDEDGLNDKEEMLNNTDPTNVDTDGDGLTDGEEVNGMQISTGEVIKTNPINKDTDNDGFLDGEEIYPYPNFRLNQRFLLKNRWF